MATTAASMNCTQEAAGRPYKTDVEEFTDVVERRLPAFHQPALRRLGNVADAEDAVQDALLSAYTHLNQFKGQAQMSTWPTTIVINSARMKLRRRPRQLHIPLDRQDGDTSVSRSRIRFPITGLTPKRSAARENLGSTLPTVRSVCRCLCAKLSSCAMCVA